MGRQVLDLALGNRPITGAAPTPWRTTGHDRSWCFFGGQTQSSMYNGDTWEWNGATAVWALRASNGHGTDPVGSNDVRF
jgi:hypothetical protein